MKLVKRDYKDEYAKFQSSDKEKKNRAARNRRRREAERSGKVSKGDGMDLHHKGEKVIVMPKEKNRGLAEKSRLKWSNRE